MPPRYSTGYQLRALIKILMAYGILANPPYAEFKALAEKIDPKALENEAKMKAMKLLHKIPIIYASGENRILAYLWKIDFNENSKVPSFYNFFPELNHNEINGWKENAGAFYFLMLQDPEDHPQITKRMEITAQIMKESGMSGETIKIQGANALEKLFWASIYGHWLAYHLALIRGVDPYSVPVVEDLKRRLK
jgi:glucose/mannose-6-phosphate isomerase